MINIIYKAQALIKQNQARYIAEEWKNETITITVLFENAK